MPEKSQLQLVDVKQKKRIIKFIVAISVLIGLSYIPFQSNNVVSRLFDELLILSGAFYSKPHFCLIARRAFSFIYFLVMLVLNIYLLKTALRQKNHEAVCISVFFFFLLIVPSAFLYLYAILFAL
jgi:hypothetical protein